MISKPTRRCARDYGSTIASYYFSEWRKSMIFSSKRLRYSAKTIDQSRPNPEIPSKAKLAQRLDIKELRISFRVSDLIDLRKHGQHRYSSRRELTPPSPQIAYNFSSSIISNWSKHSYANAEICKLMWDHHGILIQFLLISDYVLS